MNPVEHRDPSEVIGFLETLNMGSTRLLAAHELLATLVLANRYPRDASDLETLLAPLFSGNEKQAQQFRQAFRTWLAPSLPAPPPPPTLRPKRSPAWRLVWVLPLLAAVLILKHILVPAGKLPIGGSTKGSSPQSSAPPPSAPALKLGIVRASDGTPVPDAWLWYRGTSARSDQKGYFTLTAAANSRYPLLVSHREYEPKLLTIAMDGETVAIAVKRRTWLPDPVFRPVPNVAFPVLPTPQPLWPALAGAAALGLLVSAVGVWILLRAARLRKRTGRLHERVETLRLPAIEEELFPLRDTRWAASHLRRSRSRGALALATEPTVRRTAGRAGYFTPVYRQRAGIPAYVALIGRAAPGDQQAGFREALLDHLAGHQVRIEKFYFRDDPSFCDSRADATYPLERLAARFPSHTLWVFCEPEQLRDPETGLEARWLNTAAGCWSDALLLVSDRARDRSRRGKRAVLLPNVEPTLGGLGSWGAGEAPPAAAGLGREYPPSLTECPEIWRERSARPVRETARLCAELRLYLGDDGYQCLAACAIYPAMFWELTLWMSLRLMRDPATRSETLGRLVALPWFRNNHMPNWLRQRFVAGLSDSEEARIRQTLQQFLEPPMEAGGATIDVVTQPLRTIGPRRRRDYVLLSFLLGLKPDRLSMKPPGRLRRVLLNLGIVWRPAMTALPVALLLAALGYYGILHWVVPAPGIQVRLAEPRTEPTASLTDQPPGEPLDPFIAHVVDVAASAIADPVNERDPFVNWCFRVTAEIVQNSIPALYPAVAHTFEEQWTSALRTPGFAVLRAPVDPGKVKPGFVCASGANGSVAQIGVVESVYRDHAVSISHVNRQHAFARRSWRISDFTLGCIDYASSPGARTGAPAPDMSTPASGSSPPDPATSLPTSEAGALPSNQRSDIQRFVPTTRKTETPAVRLPEPPAIDSPNPAPGQFPLTVTTAPPISFSDGPPVTNPQPPVTPQIPAAAEDVTYKHKGQSGGALQIYVVDGTRQVIGGGDPVRIRLTCDGTVIHDGWHAPASVRFIGLPLNATCNVEASPKDGRAYEKASLQGTGVGDREKAVGLMLLPKDGSYDFSQATPDRLQRSSPRLWSLIAHGATDPAARYLQERDNRRPAMACLLNITTALSALRLSNGQSPLDYYKELIWDNSMAQDRFYAWADPALVDWVLRAAAQGIFKAEPSAGLSHAGATRSFRQVQFTVANLQITFHQNDQKKIDGQAAIEVETDMVYHEPGLRDGFSIIGSVLTGSLTDPRLIYALRWNAQSAVGLPQFAPPYTVVAQLPVRPVKVPPKKNNKKS